MSSLGCGATRVTNNVHRCTAQRERRLCPTDRRRKMASKSPDRSLVKSPDIRPFAVKPDRMNLGGIALHPHFHSCPTDATAVQRVFLQTGQNNFAVRVPDNAEMRSFPFQFCRRGIFRIRPPQVRCHYNGWRPAAYYYRAKGKTAHAGTGELAPGPIFLRLRHSAYKRDLPTL